MIIRMAHVREAKYCIRGARAFAERHGLDWRRFLKEGLPEEALLGTGDAMAKRIVERAHGQ